MLGELRQTAPCLAAAFYLQKRQKARPLRRKERLRQARGKPSVASTRQSALPPRAGHRGEARRGCGGQVRIAPFCCSKPSSAHSSGSTRRGEGASPAASPRAQRSPCTPGRGASRHPLAPSAWPCELQRLLAVLLSLPHRRARHSLPTPPLFGPRASPPPHRPPGPGSRRPACAPGALMSSRDCPRGLTWCLIRISRQDLSSRGSIRQARLTLPATAPRGGAECGGCR